jgi:hypothetical protein
MLSQWLSTARIKQALERLLGLQTEVRALGVSRQHHACRTPWERMVLMMDDSGNVF